MLHGIEDADGRIVVHGEETIRRCLQGQDLRRHRLGIGPVVTDTDDLLIDGHAVLQQGILIAVVPVLGDLQVHRTAIEGDAFAPRLDQMGHGVIGSHIVIDHHPTGIHTRTDTVVEHQRNTGIQQPLVMVVVTCVLRLGDDDTTDLVTVEILADAGLALILFPAEGHHDTEAPRSGGLLDTRQDGREIIMGEFWHDDTDHLRRHHPVVAQGLPDDVRIEVVLTGVGLDRLPPLFADTGRVLQGTRHRCHGDSELLGNVLHRHGHMLFHPGF